jgi:hypothetical protein
MEIEDIRAKMEVVGSCGRHVGFVEAVVGESIRLVRDTPEPDAPHHTVPLAWVAHVGQTVRLSCDSDAVRRTWGRG